MTPGYVFLERSPYLLGIILKYLRKKLYDILDLCQNNNLVGEAMGVRMSGLGMRWGW